MAAFYDSTSIKDLTKKYLVIDTNVLASCFSNVSFFEIFNDIFKDNPKLIDPIVRLEFLRGAFATSLYKEKNDFLMFNEFYPMPDHAEIYKKVVDNSIHIAHIYAHKGYPDVDLADILITSRLKEYPDYLLLTLNHKDFPSSLFDRKSVVCIERISRKEEINIEYLHVLKFNYEKFNTCFSKLPEIFR